MSAVTSRLAGLRSRWMTGGSWSCRKTIPRAASMAKRTRCLMLSAMSLSCSSLESEPFGQNSITSDRSAGAVRQTPMSSTTFGWRRLASTAASRSNASRSSVPASVSHRRLSATSVPFHLPRSTSPKPPRPTRPTICTSLGLISTQPDIDRRASMLGSEPASPPPRGDLGFAAAALASRSRRRVSRSRESCSRSCSSCDSAKTTCTGSSSE
mmetsp:Transcript_5915/g.17812  ORF Transcript_5915/g.17812 Transcript_5915/m.17812 type:complete len:211 (+) Transcript_5915:716-1348(+)